MTFFSLTSGYLAAILTGVVIARMLGPSAKGITGYAALLLAIFTTYGNGLQSAILYQCGRNGEPEALVYGAAMRILLCTMLPCAAVLIAVGVIFPDHAVLAFLGCALPFAMVNQISSGFLLIKNDIRSTVVMGAFNTFGVMLFTIPAVLFLHAGVTAVLGIWACMFVCSGLYSFLRMSRFVPPFGVGTTLAIVREQTIFSLKSGSVSVADFLNLRVDVFVVGAMLSTELLGIYSLAVATGELMWQVSRPLSWTTTGRVAAADRAMAIALTATVTRNIFAVELALGALIFAFAPAVVQFVYGSAFAQSGEVVRWLMPGLVLYATHGPLGNFMLVKEGKPLTILAVQVTSVVACAIITILTIHRFGIYGAALATSCTYAFSAIAKAWLFMRHTGLTLRDIFILRTGDLERFGTLAKKMISPRIAALARAGAQS
jgi:O-antigen/teichoic acid export membrane protein